MLVLSCHTESLGKYSCAFLQERGQKLYETFQGTHPQIYDTLACFFRNAPKYSGIHSPVPQERGQKIHEALTRFFRNAPKHSVNHLRVSCYAIYGCMADTKRHFPGGRGRGLCSFLRSKAKVSRGFLLSGHFSTRA